MNIYKIIILLLLTFTQSCLMGQRKKECSQYLGGYYGISIPLSGNFMIHTSWAVPSVEYTWHIGQWFAVGAYMGYFSSQEKGITSDQYEGDRVNGYTDRKISSFQLGIPLYFSFQPENNRFKPYMRLSGGESNIAYEITGDQINYSLRRKWSGFADLGFGCRFFFNDEQKWGLDICGTHKWSLSPWKLMDIPDNNRFEITLGILIKISRN